MLIDNVEGIEEVFKNIDVNSEDIDLMVIIDLESILGIGDWGVGGINIVIGKLVVYIVVVGIDLSRVFLVVFDVGINNEKLLNDFLYIGNCYECICGECYDYFVD